MFTGLVDDVGVVERIRQTAVGRELRIVSRYRDLEDGESIALNGVCLTVREFGDTWFDVGAVDTTLGRTTIGAWPEGTRVNLERAMRLGDRLGGHLVQGHVDGVAEVVRVERSADAILIDVQLPDELTPLMVMHGSVAVDGVSLTVNDLPAPGILQLSIIEYTARHTTLGALARGNRANVEADMVGKYIKQLVTPYVVAGRPADWPTG